MSKHIILQLDEIPQIKCSCGLTRRAFTDDVDRIASVHLLDVKKEATSHYHKKMTEIYVILDGNGFIEIEGEKFAVKPKTSIMIKPGCFHRAIGEMKILNIVIPAFNETDEFFE